MRRIIIGVAIGLGVLFALVMLARTVLFATPEPMDARAAVREGRDLLADARRVLVVVAHPDDADWYAGGTLALAARRGAKVRVIVASDGEKGPWRNRDTAAPGKRVQQTLAQVRRAEQEEAARILGYEVEFLGLPDRGVGDVKDLNDRLASIVARYQPDTLLMFDAARPRLPYVHPDHQAVGKAVAELVESGHASVAGARVFLFSTRRPDVAVDIGEVMPQKRQAIMAHASQGFGAELGNRGPWLAIRILNAIRGQGGRTGGDFLLERNATEGRVYGFGYAESFRRLR